VATLAVPCPPGEIDDPNAVKVVTALDGRALYFSRATIPITATEIASQPQPRGAAGFAGYRKHLGIYATARPPLSALPPCRPRRLKAPSALSNFGLLENGIAL